MNQNLQGYWYKTINVNTNNGARKYQLQTANTNDLALPKDSIVLGMFCRKFNFDVADKNYLGESLVNSDVANATFFDLLGKFYQQSPNGKRSASIRNFVQNYSYELMPSQPIFFEKKVVTDVDWAHSQLIISEECPTASIVANESFEFIVMYAPKETIDLESNFCFRGQDYENWNYINVEIPTQVNRNKYEIAQQNSIGIDDDCMIIGLDLREVRNRSGLSLINTNAKQCGFLNLFRNTYQFVDNLPINLLGIPQPAFNKPYVPIAPIRAGDIAWEKSNLFFSDPTTPADNQAFSFGLIYTQPYG